MSLGSAIGGFTRATLIAAATAAAAFGLLVVFQPFARPAPPAQISTVTTGAAADALQGRIEALRISLRDTETALDELKSQSLTLGPPVDDGLQAQYEAQIAAALERQALALRQADAIRKGLEAGVSVSSLAGIRDSVVIGQLLSQQATLEGQIAIEGARLRASHPTMRALTAQRASLATQIQQEASSIASALEAEARLDAAQIELLRTQLPTATAASVASPIDSTALETKASAQRAELDSLVDAYFNIPPTTTTSLGAPAANPLSVSNLLVVGVAGLAAIGFQLFLGARRRRLDRAERDAAAWEADHDPETVVVEAAEPLRQAS